MEIECKLTSAAVKGRFVPKDLGIRKRGENVSLLPMHSFAERQHWLVHIFRQKDMENIDLLCIEMFSELTAGYELLIGSTISPPTSR
jgi:hypothetical protein